MARPVRTRNPVALSGGKIRRTLIGGERPEGFGFFGGWRPDLGFDEVGPHQLHTCNLLALTGQGQLTSVLGFRFFNNDGFHSGFLFGAVPQSAFYSQALTRGFVQSGASLYKIAPDGNGRPNVDGTTLVATFTTTARCAMTEFNGKLVVCHPVDGTFDYDGTTWTLRNATVRGDTIAVWENKVWVAGDPNNPTRYWWSNAGSSATWTTASDFNEARDVNTEKIRALCTAQGVDFQGKGSLLAIKNVGVHRVTDSGTGAYKTLDAAAGCISHNAIASKPGSQIGFLNHTGFYVTDGFQVKRVSDTVRRSVFHPIRAESISDETRFHVQIAYDRWRITVPGGSNPWWLEYDELGDNGNGTWMPLFDSSTVPTAPAATMYWKAPASSAGDRWPQLLCAVTTEQYLAQVEFGTGVFDSNGNAYTAHASTGALQLAPGSKCRIRRVKFRGRGTWTSKHSLDWRLPEYMTNPAPTSRTITLAPAQPDITRDKTIDIAPTWSYGVGEAIAFYLTGTPSGQVEAGDGAYPGLLLDSIAIDFIPLV